AMLVHTVYFWLKPDLSEEDRANFQAGVESLATIASTGQVLIGTPADTVKRPVIDDSYDCALTVILTDIHAHDLYQDDPIHHKFVAECADLWNRVQVYDAD
ncbi:MAG: Dabb family protein, partial [Opitutales bacterium]